MRTSVQVYLSGRPISGHVHLSGLIGLLRSTISTVCSKKKKASNISFFHRHTHAILPPPLHACDHCELLHRATRIRPLWKPPSWGLLAVAFFSVATLHLAPSRSAPRPVSLTLLLSPAPACSCFTVVAPAPALRCFVAAPHARLATPVIAPSPVLLLMLCPPHPTR
jgi:hypothetical protein